VFLAVGIIWGTERSSTRLPSAKDASFLRVGFKWCRNLEGGIVAEILVEAGQIVSKGQR